MPSDLFEAIQTTGRRTIKAEKLKIATIGGICTFFAAVNHGDSKFVEVGGISAGFFCIVVIMVIKFVAVWTFYRAA